MAVACYLLQCTRPDLVILPVEASPHPLTRAVKGQSFELYKNKREHLIGAYSSITHCGTVDRRSHGRGGSKMEKSQRREPINKHDNLSDGRKFGTSSQETDRVNIRTDSKQPEKFPAPCAAEFPRSREQQKKSHGYVSFGNEGEDPYRILDNGRKVYLDELDVITLLDPPSCLQPFNCNSYNHAAFLWKKIGDVPEERRHHLFDLLQPKHITKMWATAELRYDDPDSLVQDFASMLLGGSKNEFSEPTFWYGRVNEVPWFLGWLSRFEMAFFLDKDNNVYGRVLPGGSFSNVVANSLAPLYFQVRLANKLANLENEECDLAFEFGDGQLHLKDSLPKHFPVPGRHPPPFKDGIVAYVRFIGPRILVGQMWYPHRNSDVLDKFLGEFVLQQEVNNVMD